jgi:hypothetical protein
MSYSTEDVVGRLRSAEFAVRQLAVLRFALTPDERLLLAERLRDTADCLDHGAAQRNPPTPLTLQEPAPQPEPPPNFDEVRIAVRPLGAKHRTPSRPARPRNIVAAD